jgi:hypothetical protein
MMVIPSHTAVPQNSASGPRFNFLRIRIDANRSFEFSESCCRNRASSARLLLTVEGNGKSELSFVNFYVRSETEKGPPHMS